jgi:hypothetical protein
MTLSFHPADYNLAVTTIGYNLGSQYSRLQNWTVPVIYNSYEYYSVQSVTKLNRACRL